MKKVKAQNDAKLEQRVCFSRLRAYGTYGPRNSQRDIMTAAELAQTNPQDLVDILHNLLSYEHTVLYYGPRNTTDLGDLLGKEHQLPAELKAPLAFEEYMEQPTPVTEILLAPYDNMTNVFNSKLPVFYGPLARLVKNPFPSDSYASNVKAKTLILYSTKDEIIPARLSRNLIQTIAGDKEVIEFKNFTHSEMIVEKEVYEKVSDFIHK